ncbi:50S ribosomal protein L33 [Lentibacillus halodurans]|nr:50S ribosomal protein L33 [Lentibacillus halodurans]
MNKKIVIACAECANRNYTTSKNLSKQPERLEARKYCRICGQHTWHRETK